MGERAGGVKVVHGANDDVFDGLAGVAVGVVQRSLADAFNVPATAASFINDSPVSPTFRLREGDVLEFVQSLGRKAALDPDELARLERIEKKLDRLQELLALARVKETYTAEEVAAQVGKSAWVVRQWCNLGQVPGAYKIRTGRGKKGEWRVPHESVVRLQNEGPQPLPE